MKKERLTRYLNSVGKRCFVQYFELFIDEDIKNCTIAAKIRKNSGFTEKACNSRTGHARMIIHEGGAEKALKIICKSKRLHRSVKSQAALHLEKIMGTHRTGVR